MANKYVSLTASGTDSGEDWTNAHPTLPSTLVREDVYEIPIIVDGVDLDTLGSGTLYLYLNGKVKNQ